MIFLFFIHALLFKLTLALSANDAKLSLRVQIPAEPYSLDPSMAEDGLSLRVLNAIRQGLVRYDENHKLTGDHAARIETSKDGMKFKFTLKPSFWTDGKKVVAQDYVYAFQKTLAPGAILKLAEFLLPISNAKKFKDGTLKDFSKVGVKALAEDILEITLEKSYSPFLHALTLPIGYPQRESVDLTNGPYFIKQKKPQQEIILERSSSFSKKLSNIDQIRFLILPEEAAAVALFEKGELDLLTRIPTLESERLRKLGKAWSFDFFATAFLAFNQKKIFWEQKDARCAIASSIDKNKIESILAGEGKAATDWLSSTNVLKKTQAYYQSYKPKLAQKLWANRKTKADIELGFDMNARNLLIAQLVQNNLKTNLGLQTKIEMRDWKMHIDSLTNNPSEIYRFGWLSPFADVYAQLSLFGSKSSSNYTGWKNEKFDELLDKILQFKLGSSERTKLARKAEKILFDECVVIPLYHYNQNVISSKRVRQLQLNGFGQFNLRKTEVDPVL